VVSVFTSIESIASAEASAESAITPAGSGLEAACWLTATADGAATSCTATRSPSIARFTFSSPTIRMERLLSLPPVCAAFADELEDEDDDDDEDESSWTMT
jgi:hypothetical protein